MFFAYMILALVAGLRVSFRVRLLMLMSIILIILLWVLWILIVVTSGMDFINQDGLF